MLAAGSLVVAGCSRLWIDGSFVTTKALPGDYDAVWCTRGVDGNQVDPVLLFMNGRAAIRAKYGGDLFPSNAMEASGRTFIDFFQRDRDGVRKGIVVVDLRSLP